MIYKIKNNFYVKVGNKLTKVNVKLNNDDIILEPTKEKIEITKDLKYDVLNFEQDKKEIKRVLNNKRYSDDEIERI